MYVFKLCAAIWQNFGHSKNRCRHTQLNVCEKEELPCFLYLIQIFGAKLFIKPPLWFPFITLFFPMRDKTREIVSSSNLLRFFYSVKSLMWTLKPVLARFFIRSSLQPHLHPFPLISAIFLVKSQLTNLISKKPLSLLQF